MTETIKEKARGIALKVAPIVLGLGALASSAAADITGDMTNISTVITSLTGWVTSMMNLFMQPPLVYFVALGFFLVAFRLVKGILVRRK